MYVCRLIEASRLSVVRKCSSFVIACQAFETTKDKGITVLGGMTREQARARLLRSYGYRDRP